MADGTKIEWCVQPGYKPATWNPIRARNKASGGAGHFCIHVDAGCKNCDAERLQPRFKNPVRYAAQDAGKVNIFLDEMVLVKPLRWRAPRTIFVCSMTDMFADFVHDEWLDKMLAVMALCPQHTFIVLTKRPERMRDYCHTLGRHNENDRVSLAAKVLQPDGSGFFYRLRNTGWHLPNVWLGTSVSDQASANLRLPLLLDTPAAIRFVSYEPALGPVDFKNINPRHGYASNVLAGWRHDFGIPDADLPSKLDQIIAGGESGPKARPAHPDWFRSVRDQCAEAGTAFFFKQWGESLHESQQDAQGRELFAAWRGGGWEGDRGFHHWDDGSVSLRIRKKNAGAKLDGVEHREFPKVVAA